MAQTLSEQLQADVTRSNTDSGLFHQMIHGANGTYVQTENGLVPSYATAIYDLEQNASASAAAALQSANEAAASAALLLSQKAQPNGIATLDAGGKIPVGQIPDIALISITSVVSQAAMLALTADVGDWAVRTDINQVFVLKTAGPSVLANWQQMGTVGVEANALAVLSTTGHVVRTASGTYATRTVTGTAGQVTVTNGDGVSGNPVLSLPATLTQAQTFSAIATFSSGTASTLATNGAVVISGSGGLGVGGNVNITGTITTAGITNSGLTPGRVVFASTGGLLVDDADMTFSVDTLTVTKATIGGISHIANAITAANSVTAQAATDLVLTGGSTGASITLQQGTSAIAIVNAPSAGSGALRIGNSNVATWVSNGFTVVNGATVNLADLTNATNATSGAVRFGSNWGFSGTSGNTSFTAGALNISSATASTTTSTGALIVAGGAGFGSTIYGGGNIALTGTTPFISFGGSTPGNSSDRWIGYESGAGIVMNGGGVSCALTIGGADMYRVSIASGHQFYVTRARWIPSAFSLSSWTTGGALSSHGATTVTNSSTAISGTAASAVFHSFDQPTLAATNTGVITTDAATVYIAGAPIAGTNQTITNGWGLWNAGKTRFSADVYLTHSNPKISASTNGTAYQDLTIEGNGVVIQAAANNNGVTIKPNGTGYTRVVGGTSTNTFYVTTSDWANLTTGSQIRFGFGAATGNTYGFFDVIGGGGAGTAQDFRMMANGGRVSLGLNGTPASMMHISLGTGMTSRASWGISANYLFTDSHTITDTTASGTVATTVMGATFRSGALASTSVATFTNVATVYIEGAPTAGTNATISSAWGLWNAGSTRMDGKLFAMNGTGATGTTDGAIIATGGIVAGGGINAGGMFMAKWNSNGVATGADPGFYRDTAVATWTDIWGFGNGSRVGLLRGYQNGGNTVQWSWGGLVSAGTYSEHMVLSGQANALTTGALHIYLTTASTTTTSGALLVDGGVGVAGRGTFGSISSPDGSNSEKFGAGAAAPGPRCVAVGVNAIITGDSTHSGDCVLIGYGATLGSLAADYSAQVVIGQGAAGGYTGSTVIGYSATANASIAGSNSYGIAIGRSSATTGGIRLGAFGNAVSNSISIGYSTTVATGGHIVLSNGNTDSEVWAGAYIGAAAAYYTRINGTTGPTTGGIVYIAGGKGATAGDTGGAVIIQTAVTGAGTTLVDRLTVSNAGRATWAFSNFSLASWTTSGALTNRGAATVTDSSTAISGTAASAVFHSFAIPTLAATNATVTTTDAATVYIAGQPVAGTNQTITNAYALWVGNRARFDGNVFVGTSGGVTVQTNGTVLATFYRATMNDTSTYSASSPGSGAMPLELLRTGGAATGRNMFMRFGDAGACIGYFGTVQNAGARADFVWNQYGTDNVYAERMRLSSDGVLTLPMGVTSTTTTSGTLVVTGGGGFSGALNIGGAFSAGGVAAITGKTLTVNHTVDAWSSNYAAFQFGNGGAVWSHTSGGNDTYFTSNTYYNGTNYIAQATAAAERLALGATAFTFGIAGSVGAGSPQTFIDYAVLNTTTLKLGNIAVTANANYQEEIYSTAASTGGARVNRYKARGTGSALGTVVTGDYIGDSYFYAHDGTGYIEAAAIHVKSTGTVATNRTGAQVEIWTHPDSTSANRLVATFGADATLLMNGATWATGQILLGSATQAGRLVLNRGTDASAAGSLGWSTATDDTTLVLSNSSGGGTIKVNSTAANGVILLEAGTGGIRNLTNSAITNVDQDVLRVTATSSGTVVAGYGPALRFEAKGLDNTTYGPTGKIWTELVSGTGANQYNSAIKIAVRNAGNFNTVVTYNTDSVTTFGAGIASTTTTTGTVVITGGLGASGAINSGSTITAASGSITGQTFAALGTNSAASYPMVIKNNAARASNSQYVGLLIQTSDASSVDLGLVYFCDATPANRNWRLGAFDNAGSGWQKGVIPGALEVQSDLTVSTGQIILSTAGKGLTIKTGSNAKAGTATLVAGTVTVSNTAVTATSIIYLTVKTVGGTQGILSYTQVNGTSFTINSTNAADTSTIGWFIVEQN